MTVKEALKLGKIDTLDRELLLAHVLKIPRTTLFTNTDRILTPAKMKTYKEYVRRREKKEPLAYITGEKEFAGRIFLVDRTVLIPRPATEELIAASILALQAKKNLVTEIDTNIIAFTHFFRNVHPKVIVDIGTGSGVIAITVARDKKIPVIATDLSKAALTIAKNNAKRLKAKVTFLQGNLLQPMKTFSKPFFVISNPPYIPTGTTLMKEVGKYEPKMALFSGKDGLSAIRKLVKQCQKHPKCVGFSIECRADQRAAIESFLGK